MKIQNTGKERFCHEQRPQQRLLSLCAAIYGIHASQWILFDEMCIRDSLSPHLGRAFDLRCDLQQLTCRTGDIFVEGDFDAVVVPEIASVLRIG